MGAAWAPRLAVLGAALLWSLTGPHARVAYAWGLSPVDAVLWRAGSAWVLLLAWRAYSGRRRPAVRDGVGPRDGLGLIAVHGAVGIAAFYLLYFWSLQLNPLPVAAVLLYTAPVFVTLAEWAWEGRAPGPGRAAALAAALAGVFLVGGPVAGGVSLPGLLAGLGSGAAYAAYVVVGRRLASRLPAEDALLGGLSVGVALLALAAWFAPGPPVRYTAASVAWLAAGGLALTLVPYGLFLIALRRLRGGEASLLATVEPLLAVAWGWLWLGEVPSAAQAAGVALILAAITVLGGERAAARRRLPA